jgi:uncharacterized protein YwgA
MEKYAKLLAIFDQVKTIHSRIKAQKILYVLKSLGFPVTERYEYGNYGPYSQELASELRSLVNSEFLSETEFAGEDFTEEGAVPYQRYDLSITGRGKKFLEAFSSKEPGFLSSVQGMTELAEELDQYHPPTLELIATLMFLQDQGTPEWNVIPTLKSLKPQFTDGEIQQALSVIAELRKRFSG